MGPSPGLVVPVLKNKILTCLSLCPLQAYPPAVCPPLFQFPRWGGKGGGVGFQEPLSPPPLVRGYKVGVPFRHELAEAPC